MRGPKLCRGVVALSVCLGPGVATADGIHIGSFATNRQDWHGAAFPTSSDYDVLRKALEARGDTTGTITALSPDELAPFDVFYTSLIDWYAPTFTDGERNALDDWVVGGGVLISAGDYAVAYDDAADERVPIPNRIYNDLLRPFGVSVAGLATSNYGLPLGGAPLLLDGPNGKVGPFEMAASGIISGTALTPVARAAGGGTVVGVQRVGSGWVVVTGDWNMFTDEHIGPSALALFLNALDLPSDV